MDNLLLIYIDPLATAARQMTPGLLPSAVWPLAHDEFSVGQKVSFTVVILFQIMPAQMDIAVLANGDIKTFSADHLVPIVFHLWTIPDFGNGVVFEVTNNGLRKHVGATKNHAAIPINDHPLP